MVSRTMILTVALVCGAVSAAAGCSSASTGTASSGTSTSASSAVTSGADPSIAPGDPSAATELGGTVGNSVHPAAISPCARGQVVVSGAALGAAMMHRGVQLTFALAPGAAPCTLQGYPGVDTGAGGPVVHATRTPTGYMGGPGAGTLVTVQSDHPAHAIVEATAMGPDGGDCTMYSTLLVTPPNTTDTQTVSVGINGCELQVHPITG